MAMQNERRYPDALRVAAACVRIKPDFAQASASTHVLLV